MFTHLRAIDMYYYDLLRNRFHHTNTENIDKLDRVGDCVTEKLQLSMSVLFVYYIYNIQQHTWQTQY